MRGCVWLRFGRNGRRSPFHLLVAIDRLPTGVGQFSCPMGTSRWSFCLTFGLLWLTVSLTWGSSVDQTVGTTSAARCAVRCLSQLQVSHSSEIRYVTGNVVQRLLCRMLCSVKSEHPIHGRLAYKRLRSDSELQIMQWRTEGRWGRLAPKGGAALSHRGRKKAKIMVSDVKK